MNNPTGHDHATRRPRSFRRLRALGLGVVLAAIALEAALQIVSYFAWQQRVRIERPVGRVLLCIGDSLTFGLGAQPSEAYPPRLQEQLAARGIPWSVVNEGVPGQSSADVLDRLPDLLTSLRPDAVCLLVGWNDTWARPALVSSAQPSSSGFPLRWRTARLIALLIAREDSIARATDLPFLGAWHVENQEFYFAADGTARFGSLLATWTVDGDLLQITPAGGEALALRWRLADRALEFAMLGWDRFHRARRGPPVREVDLDHIRDMLRRGELDAAAATLGQGGAGIGSLRMRAEVSLALADAGRIDEARQLFVPLQDAWERIRDADAGEAVAQWLARSGETARAIDVARVVLRTHGDRLPCWRVLVQSCSAKERPQLAAELEVAAAKQTSPWQRAELTLERAVVQATLDAKASVTTLVNARGLGIGPDESIAAMTRAVAQGADRQALLDAVARVELAADARLALDRDMRRATVDDAEMLGVLEQHLQLAITTCRAAGSRVFLLGYPFPLPKHEARVRQVARRHDVPFLSLVDTFELQLTKGPRSDWFVDPIHCTARGYELMARVIADRLSDVLR